MVFGSVNVGSQHQSAIVQTSTPGSFASVLYVSIVELRFACPFYISIAFVLRALLINVATSRSILPHLLPGSCEPDCAIVSKQPIC